MILDCTDQLEISPALPLRRTVVYSGSALPIVVRGIPVGCTALTVALTNADGNAVSVAADNSGGDWLAVFTPSCFPTYGYVENGVKVIASMPDCDDNCHSVIVGVGDLDIIQASPETRPGDPRQYYQTKGGDIYVKSEIINGVQHYKALTIAYNSRLRGWGFADPSGDYILVDGAFVEV